LADGQEMAVPGDNVKLTVELGKPVAISTGCHFAIREGGKTVGSGIVTEIMD
jgi:elongation factor Tu